MTLFQSYFSLLHLSVGTNLRRLERRFPLRRADGVLYKNPTRMKKTVTLLYTVMSSPNRASRAWMTWPCIWAIWTFELDTLYSNFKGNSFVRCVLARFFFVLDTLDVLGGIASCLFAVEAVLSSWWPSEISIIVGAVR
jgi:hypothetical protein